MRVPLIAPDEAAVRETQDLIKHAYEDDYRTAAKNPGPLIQKLLAAASQTKDPVRKYAFLVSAEEAAATGGDYGRTMELIDIRAGDFVIDGIQPRIDRLGEFLTTKNKTDPEVLIKLYEYAIETAERGVKQDSLEQAKVAADVAARIAKSIFLAGKAKKNDRVADDGEAKQAQARALVKEIDRRAVLFAEYQKASETHKAQPDDPVANGVIGRYLCFESGDWEKGLPFLAKCDQKAVAEIAAEQLEVFDTEKPVAKHVFELAGKWWNAANQKANADDVSSSLRAHATTLYQSVRGRLDDPLDEALAATRGGEPLMVAPRKPLATPVRELAVTVHLTSDWGSVTFHPASSVEIRAQEVVKGGQQWKVDGNKVELKGQPYRRNDNTVQLTCRLKGSAKELLLETHKGDIGALHVEALSGGKVLGQFSNEGNQGGNAQRSDTCRREFRVVLQ